MSVSKKIIAAVATLIKINDTLKHLSEEVKVLVKEMRDLDRRVVRLEAFIEVSEKRSRLALQVEEIK